MDEELETIARRLHAVDKQILVERAGFNGRLFPLPKVHPAETWEQVPVGRQLAYLERAKAFVAADCTVVGREQAAWSNLKI